MVKNIDAMDVIEVEEFWDPILSDDTKLELDWDYIQNALQAAKKEARAIECNLLVGELIQGNIDTVLKVIEAGL